MIDIAVTLDRYHIRSAKFTELINNKRYADVKDLAITIYKIANRHGLYCPTILSYMERGICLCWSGDADDKFSIFIYNKRISYSFIHYSYEEFNTPITMLHVSEKIKEISRLL